VLYQLSYGPIPAAAKHDALVLRTADKTLRTADNTVAFCESKRGG
jgi:hypothetical protein